MHAYLVQCAIIHRTGSPFQQMETLEISELNDGRSILAMFLTVLFKEDGIETEILK